MDLKSILEILRTVNKSDLTELEIEEKDFKLKIKKGSGTYQVVPQQILPVTGNVLSSPLNLPVYPSPPQELPVPTTPSEPKEEPASTSKSNTIFIKSPMIGTFYRSPGPDKEPYVKVGDMIRPKQVLCLIEAMKLFNEVESEVEGKIVRILVENAQPVEYDQPLFEVELV
ncbi:MAG: hypothetical protein KatS3mg035_0506 [Bacteroidia bacterium]|nr:MAG: hypothetical protein KatS3mg035_0506 [Bacteroidia bacterium]